MEENGAEQMPLLVVGDSFNMPCLVRASTQSGAADPLTMFFCHNPDAHLSFYPYNRITIA